MNCTAMDAAKTNHTGAPTWRIVAEVTPAPVSRFYKVGLGAVAFVMVLLPVLYIGIIVLVAYAVYDHAVYPRYQLGSGLWALLGYLAPIIVGTILVFFMIKPLFARRSKAVEALRLEPQEEPELFRFVNTICDLVKAPRPRCVQLNLQINAYASLHRGLLGLFRRDLTLTIGLPLVAGLNLRQFGGVLAHE